MVGVSACGHGRYRPDATPRQAAGELTVWWTQVSTRPKRCRDAWMADWEKKNNTKVNLTIMNGPDVITKLIAGMQVGDVPDVVHTVTGDRFLVPRAAWNDQLEDVSEVVEAQKAEFTETALISARLYNAKQKKYSYYGVPTKASSLMNSVWLPLLEEVGFSAKTAGSITNIRFFPTVQDKLRSIASVCSARLSMREGRSGNLFHSFCTMGRRIVTPDGKLNRRSRRAQAHHVAGAAATPFNKGYVPPGAINWAVDTNTPPSPTDRDAPHATISIAAAQMDKPDLYYRRSYPRVPWAMGKRCRACALAPPHPESRKRYAPWVAAFSSSANNALKETRARYRRDVSIVKNDRTDRP